MPLKQLYRSHILQIARHIGVPAAVLERSPDPEMLPGVEDKYFDTLRVPSDTVDRVLYGLEHGMSNEEVAEQTGVGVEKTAEIREMVDMSSPMRSPSMSMDPLAPTP